MKSIKKFSTIIIFTFLISLIGLRFYKAQQKSGSDFASSERINIVTGEKISFPVNNQNFMAIYWATWCAPCKVEMYRLKQSVEKDQSLSKKIFAINMSEDASVVKKFLAKTPYPFQFVSSSEIDQKIGITATPTQVLIKDNKIDSFSEGLSIIGVWKAEYFLKD